MLKRLIEFSLRQSALVLMLSVLLVVVAVIKVQQMPVDVFPELNAPTVVVLTEAGGLAADEVEQYVTFPVETAVNGLPGVRRVRSASAISLSLVWIEFDWGSDLYRARQMVSERLATVRESLPPEAHAEITPITSITGEIMLLSLTSADGTASELDLRAYAEFDLRNKLLAVPGIAQVIALGGELPEYQINLRQDLLALHGLTGQDVIDAAKGAHSTASAGYLPNIDRQEIPIRQAARVRSVDDIKATIIPQRDSAAGEGVRAPVTIGQVADVSLGPAPRRGTAADKGKPAVVVSIQKSPDTNTLALTAAIDKALDQVEQALPKGMTLNRAVFRQADFIERSVTNVVHVLRDATIIVVVILILFLLNVRTTIITMTALPLSLAAAMLALWGLGLSINVMTLGGLAVAVGVLVDDAIIDVENVFRRLKEWPGAGAASSPQSSAISPGGSLPPFEHVIFDASNEIRPSMVFATIIIVIVFVPLLFLQGLEGRFFRPLAITYIVSILASLVVALTVTPALCKHLLRPKHARRTSTPHAPLPDAHSSSPETRDPNPETQTAHHHDAPLVRWLKRRYEPMLRWSIRRRGPVLAAAAIVTFLSLLLGRTFGTSFLPEFNEGTFTVFLMAPPGTSLDESNRLARGIESRLTEIPGVRSVARRTGRAERDEHAEPVSSSEIEVTVAEGADYRNVRRQIDEIIANVPGVTTMVGQPIEHRLSHVLSGTPAAIAVNVYGEDLAKLRQIAQEIEVALKAVPGARDVAANREVLVTSLPIRYRLPDLAAAGLSPGDAAEQVKQALYGERIAEVNQGVRRYDIVVRLDPEERERVDQIEDLLLRSSNGATVRLRDVADIGPERTSNLIARENAQRKAVISCNVAEGYNLGDLVGVVQEKVDPIVHRAGYTVHYGGQFEAQQSASRTLLIAGAGVLFVMLLLLQLSTGSLKAAVLVMINLPLSIIGGIAAVYLTQSQHLVESTLALLGFGSGLYRAPVVSIASMVGFITLFGIAVRNGILLVNHYQHIAIHEGKPLDVAIVQGSMERLVPILMTALCAALGLLPLALAMGKPGSELLAPLAVVVLGGLISSTFLNVIVVPAAYSLFFGVKPAGEAGGARTSGLFARLNQLRRGHAPNPSEGA